MNADTPHRSPDTSSCLMTNGSFSVGRIASSPLRVNFWNTDGTRALFIVDKGTVTFEGNADAAAQLFIDALTRRHAEQWTALEQRVLVAEAELSKLSHHNALMHISHQLAAAERQLKQFRLQSAPNRGNHCSEQCIHYNQYEDCFQKSKQALEMNISPINPVQPGALQEVADE
ncbi:hypothetical protein WKG92_19800 [Pantoea agglomerans]|uniref:hypothetical protein n=1 Tax=Enterobacter agglomerans TaxID=549 RepID=UPI003C79FADE